MSNQLAAMLSLMVPLLLSLGLSVRGQTSNSTSTLGCRNIPGSFGFPTAAQWSALNTSLSGRLVTVIPSAQFCKNQGGCTLQQFTSSVFRANIPGAMNQVCHLHSSFRHPSKQHNRLIGNRFITNHSRAFRFILCVLN